MLVLLVIAAAMTGLWWTRRDRAPGMPPNGDHVIAQSEQRCLSCHGHTQRRPRPVNHPLRDDCFSCHRDDAGRLHTRPGAPTTLPGGWRDDPRLERRQQERP
jgi:hypothetical protein